MAIRSPEQFQSMRKNKDLVWFFDHEGNLVSMDHEVSRALRSISSHQALLENDIKNLQHDCKMISSDHRLIVDTNRSYMDELENVRDRYFMYFIISVVMNIALIAIIGLMKNV